MVAELVGDDVGLGEVARARRSGCQLAEEAEVEVHLAVGRAVEGPGRRGRRAAGRCTPSSKSTSVVTSYSLPAARNCSCHECWTSSTTKVTKSRSSSGPASIVSSVAAARPGRGRGSGRCRRRGRPRRPGRRRAARRSGRRCRPRRFRRRSCPPGDRSRRPRRRRGGPRCRSCRPVILASAWLARPGRVAESMPGGRSGRPPTAIHSPPCRPPSPTGAARLGVGAARRGPRARRARRPGWSPAETALARDLARRGRRRPWWRRCGRDRRRRRPARRGVLPAAAARAAARRRRHLHAGGDRRVMVAWAAREGAPARVVDPGAGSGRFAVAAGRRFGAARLVGGRARPAGGGGLPRPPRGRRPRRARQGGGRATTARRRSAADGPTLYLGNPPYVRHHQIPPGWKEWLAMTARAQACEASRLAGLHVHFFLATAARARAGRPRRLHHVVGVARHQLRAPGARAPAGRPRAARRSTSSSRRPSPSRTPP